MVKISIIVPVYKVEQLLKKCVESLINQTYADIEILLIDDGSPDNCPKMCDEFAKNDERIKVYHKKNGGLSDARNYGLRKTSGEYVLFVDSDDYIELDTCEAFVDVMDHIQPDVITGNANRIENDKSFLMTHTYFTDGKAVSGAQFLKKELSVGTMYMAAWLNLYKKSFLVENQLEFKVGLLHEDEEFTPRVFLKAQKVISLKKAFYNYLIREGSITTSKNKLINAEHIIQTCRELERIYELVEDEELRLWLYDNIAEKYLTTFQMAQLYKTEGRHLLDNVFLKNKAYKFKNKVKVALFRISPKLYYQFNKLSKMLGDV